MESTQEAQSAKSADVRASGEIESLREQRDNLARALDIIAGEDGYTTRASWLIGVARNALRNLDIDLRFGAECCGGDGCCDPANCSRKDVARP